MRLVTRGIGYLVHSTGMGNPAGMQVWVRWVWVRVRCSSPAPNPYPPGRYGRYWTGQWHVWFFFVSPLLPLLPLSYSYCTIYTPKSFLPIGSPHGSCIITQTT